MVFTQFPRLQGQLCLLDYMIKIRLPIFVTRAEQKLHKVEEMYLVLYQANHAWTEIQIPLNIDHSTYDYSL